MLQKLISVAQYNKLIDHFGKLKVNRVTAVFEKYIKLWELENCELIPYYSINILFKVYSKRFGACVLKLNTVVDQYTNREITFLSSNMPMYCKLHVYDVNDGVMLLEYVESGVSLHKIEPHEARVEAFCSVFEMLHQPFVHDKGVKNIELYPSYEQLLTNIKNWAEEKRATNIMTYIHDAITYYNILKENYSAFCLLHGDLHHDNILYRSSTSFVVIDPKGVIDMKILDIPCFILNECEQIKKETDRSKMINIINYLSHKLNVEQLHLAYAFYIHATLSITWTIQDDSVDQRTNDYIADYLFCKSFIDLY